LQHTVEQNHLVMLAQLDSLRDSLNDKIDKSNWQLINRMDRQFYWLAGILIAQMTTSIAILLRFIGP